MQTCNRQTDTHTFMTTTTAHTVLTQRHCGKKICINTHNSTYTHFCKSLSERAPHDAVDDGVDTRVEACQNSEPTNQAQVGQMMQSSSQHHQVCHIQRCPTDGENGDDRQARQNQSGRHRARCVARSIACAGRTGVRQHLTGKEIVHANFAPVCNPWCLYLLIFIDEKSLVWINAAVSAVMLSPLVNIHDVWESPLCENIMSSTKLEVY